MDLKSRPLTLANWDDLELLFGSRGACGGCWCMTMRLAHSVYEKNKGAPNRKALKQLVADKQPTGTLAYAGEQPVGWCSIAPREQFIRLKNSRILKPVDDKPVWSIVCLFVAKDYRQRNVSIHLIEAASDFAFTHGAEIVEAYPQIPRKKKIPDVFAFNGIASTFEKAGFVEVARRSETRPMMRLFNQHS